MRNGARLWGMALAWLIVVATLAGCGPISTRQPTAIPTSTSAPTSEPTSTPTSTPTAEPTHQPTNTPTPESTSTPTPEPTDTPSPTPTVTVTPTVTPTPTRTPGPTPDGRSRSVRMPILMYHYVSVPPANADAVRRDLSVSPERFESHLKYLQGAGYRVVTLDDLLYALTLGRSLPERAVVLTFDDGYEDNYTFAFPLLQKYGVAAHFFIISDFVNEGRAGYMTWPQIEQMATAGQRFGTHSRDHPDLQGKPTAYLVWQALGGLEAIQAHLGYHPRWVAYPSGRYDAQTIAVYRSAGYWGGVITAQGATHTLDGIFELQRVRVRGSHTAEDLAALLALDW